MIMIILMTSMMTDIVENNDGDDYDNNSRDDGDDNDEV